ncbi:MAG: hypothetical protein FJ026_04530 [Chloroflexi bacterium]|nr:hypothetical protein [Chloroflexota bacterium]
MNSLVRLVRSHWAEILVSGVFLQSLIAAIFTLNPRIILITALGGLAMLVVVFGTVAVVQRRRSPMRGENTAFQVPRQGLIFTVGYQSATIRIALDNQKPTFVGFICSAQTEQVVDNLVAEYGYDAEHCKKDIVDPQNFVEIRTKTGLMLDWLAGKGLQPVNIAADITGGTTVMSVGVFSMTEERRVDSQYIRSAFDENNRPIPGSQQAILVSRYSEAAR